MNFSEIFEKYKVIAVLGFSQNPARPSNRIARYLNENGFIVYGVNPNLKDKIIDGIKCFEELKSVPDKIQLVNIFRRSEFLQSIMNEILHLNYIPEVVWAQIGVMDKKAEEIAAKNQISYIENKCIMTEHHRLFL
ncbi:MAG TPA: CoA-binding protein [Ignavibacteria bacterium]|nr:CoA-binding protein [Ignavibacteria bacterium]